MKQPASLRLRLLIAVLLAVALTAPFTLWEIYGDAHHEMDELFDAQLEQLARTHLTINAASDIAAMPDVVHEYTRKLLARHIWLDGRQPARWESEPGQLPAHIDIGEGFGDLQFQDRTWRYFAAWSADRSHQVLVMQDYTIRKELAAQLTQRVGLLSIIHALLLAGLISLLLGLALRPLRAVVLALSAPDPLQVRLPPADSLPRELAVVVAAFDRLIGRFRTLLERERHFAATAAHELRTPLAGLSAQLQLIETRAQLESKDLAQAQNAVRHLGKLVDQLLLMARLDAQQVQARLESVHLHELVLETAALVQDNWPQKDIDWTISPSDDPCWQVHGDPTLLRILLLNLLDNACKHGSANPHVTVQVFCTGTQRLLSIKDNGPGIPSDWMNMLQQRFTRASNSTSGLGLGLALVREIALLHGGSLRLEHADTGGLHASITLPAFPVAA